jgi:alkanesulfonate monooxygenase SsuD/methylene tetrahydromethanopterin reductase-like flavin-dependent oxidoreductase (luciferase family)
MNLGALCFLTEYSISPSELAQELEAHGFESLWVGDHSHVPVDPDAQAAIDSRTGDPVPTHYSHLMDPFLVLTYAAAVTSKIRLGTGICLINERDYHRQGGRHTRLPLEWSLYSRCRGGME